MLRTTRINFGISLLAFGAIAAGCVAPAQPLGQPGSSVAERSDTVMSAATDSMAVKIKTADSKARAAMAIYADWVEDHYCCTLNTYRLKVDALAKLSGYTFLHFDGDTNYGDHSDDTKVVLFKGTPKDLATANNVVFFVPGTGTTWSNGITGGTSPVGWTVKESNWIGSADLIAAEARKVAPKQTTTSIAWLGYDTPRFTTDNKLVVAREVVTGASPASSLFANEGGKTLAAHINSFTSTAQHTTLVGHSYGSPVTGYALWKYKAKGVNEVVGAGSPGLAVQSRTPNETAGRCNGKSADGVSLPTKVKYTRECVPEVGPGHYWALQTEDDWLIGKNGVCWWVYGANRCGWLGDTMHGDHFGAHEMNTKGGTYPAIKEHGDYYRKKDGKVPLSTVNTARVVVGRYDLANLESKAPGTAYPARIADPKPPTPPSPTTTVPTRPVPMKPSKIATGALHSCAVTTGGAAKCWGYNLDSQLGDGTLTNRSKPIGVVGLSSGVAGVAGESCVLTTSGGVKCWGPNYWGDVGDGTTVSRTKPVNVVGLTSGVAMIDKKGQRACAVTTAGAVKCWGYNSVGQIGDGTTVNRSKPVNVSGLTSGVTAVAVSYDHSCALTAAGAVKCWGSNHYGELGDGTTVNRTKPVNVAGLTSGVKAIATGNGHSCAITSNGAVRCWGYNRNGALGDSTTTNRSIPVATTGLTSGVKAITAGWGHTCALVSTGGVKCWGWDEDGQLGPATPSTFTCITNQTCRSTTPISITGLTSGVAAISAGGLHTCAVVTGGAIKCWGGGSEGQLGHGKFSNSRTPVAVVGFG